MLNYIEKSFVMIILTLIMLAGMMCAMPLVATAGTITKPNGSGTANDPYLIASEENLNWLQANYSSNTSSKFVQTADITLTSSDFAPIGDTTSGYYNGFTGTYDGGWHTISNLQITSVSNANYIGLFILIGNGGSVRNLKLASVNICLSNRVEWVGAIAGQNAGTIENCSIISGSIVGGPNTQVGGIAGRNGGTISSCYNLANVSVGNYDARLAAAGGIAGDGNGGFINNCYNTGNINGGSTASSGGIFVGGIAGFVNSANAVTNCYSTGTVSSAGGTNGGIVGWAFDGSCSSNYYLTGACSKGIGMLNNDLAGSESGAASQSADDLKKLNWNTDPWSQPDEASYPALLNTAKVPEASTAVAADSNVTVTWQSAKRAGGYRVYWRAESDTYNDTNSKLVYGYSANSTTVTGLDYFTKYYFVVKAYGDGDVLSDASNELSATPELKITNLVANPGNGKVSLTFTVPPASTSVVLYISTDAGTNYSIATTEGTLGITSTSATVNSLANGTNYTFKLIATVSGHEVVSNTVLCKPIGSETLVGAKGNANFSEIPFITLARTNVLVGPLGSDSLGWYNYAFKPPVTGEYTIFTEDPTKNTDLWICTVDLNIMVYENYDEDNVAGKLNFKWTGTLDADKTYYLEIWNNSVTEAIDLCISGGGLNPLMPTVTSMDPTSGTTAGGTIVKINGTYFTGATAVHFGSTSASSYTINSATQITATAPAGSAGTVDVTVTTAGITSATSSSDQFTYIFVVPEATTNAAGSITSTGATLNGSINANNASTAVTFEYGNSTSYGTSVTAIESPVSGNTVTPVSYALTGLTPNTTYHYRVVGVSTAGTTYGLDETFTTSAAAPTNHAPTAKNTVPTQAITGTATTSFSASDIAQDEDTADTLTITSIITNPDAATATAALDSGTVTVTGVVYGTTTVIVEVSDGTLSVDVTVPIIVTAIPSQNSTISPTTTSFDKMTSAQKDVLVTLTLNGNTLSSIQNGSNMLTSGADYTVSDTMVTISKTYLATLSTGDTTLTFNFSAGSSQAMVVTVSDSTSIDECFIATAAFGSKFTWPVALLRHFRDQYLLTNSLGTAFVQFYYQNSPPIAHYITGRESLKFAARVLLSPFIAVVYLMYHPVLASIILLILLAGFFLWRRKQLRVVCTIN